MIKKDKTKNAAMASKYLFVTTAFSFFNATRPKFFRISYSFISKFFVSRKVKEKCQMRKKVIKK